MIQLFGFPMSTYYSIVKMYLLEKDIAFEEHHEDIVLTDNLAEAGNEVIRTRSEAYWQKSPVGKVPCIGTPHGYLSETQLILEYLEDAYPSVPLMPRDPWARAKARELVRVLDLHVELVMRRLYASTFFGGSTTEATKCEVQELLTKGVNGVARLTQLSPYAFASSFTQVDCVAAIHLPVAAAVMRKAFGEDLGRTLPHLPEYLERIGERPSYRSAMAVIQSKLVELG